MSSNDDRIVPDRGTTDVVGARIGAQLIDTLVLFVQMVAVVFLLVLLVRPSSRAGAEALALLALLTLPLYGGLLEGYWNGQTLGKRVLGIKVVDRRGAEPGVGQALVRNAPAVILFSWITTAVALAAIATGDDRQRVFDGVAGTYVVDATRGNRGSSGRSSRTTPGSPGRGPRR